MAYEQSLQNSAWSKSGAIIALVAMASAASAWVVALQPVRFSTPALALAWVVAVGGVCIIARGRMPMPVKAVLLAGVCGSLLTCFATQDVLGLRRVETKTRDAFAEAAANGPVLPRTTGVVDVTGDTAATAGIAGAVSAGAGSSLAGSNIGLSAQVSATDDGAYRLNWSLTRDQARQWCGVITDSPGAARRPFADFGRQLAVAVARSRDGALECE